MSELNEGGSTSPELEPERGPGFGDAYFDIPAYYLFGVRGPLYPAKISLDRTWLVVDGVKKTLKPGMHVAAEIKTGDRRVLEYLLSPIMQATKEAGRER